MERVSITEVNPDAGVLARAAKVLRDGGLIGYPTETFYGIGADPRSDRAVDGLFRAKARPPTVAVPLIAGSLDQLVAVAGGLPALARALAERFWPGPLTLVIPAWKGLSVAIHGGQGTVAVRVPGHLVARSLCEAFGHPITSTSANLSGGTPPADADAVATSLASSLAMLLDCGRTPGGPSSTIVDVLSGAPRLVRPGAIAWEQVLECLE
ncbi:MAG: L-threonylcarbamoyladenylate synthase [Acidobacteria bacterium]|nr:L-threonylcarbamoyladenylate synthase [Acidobacteriota bacterium]